MGKPFPHQKELLIQEGNVIIHTSTINGIFLISGGEYGSHAVDYRKKNKMNNNGWTISELTGLFAYLRTKDISSLLVDMWLLKMNEGE